MSKDKVEQPPGFAALHFDLAQGTDVDDASPLTHRTIFTFDALVLISSAGRVVVARSLPIPHVHPHSAQRVVLIVHRRAAYRMMSHAGEHAERHGRSRRP